MSDYSAMRSMLEGAGFTCTRQKKHERWTHPTGVWTMMHSGGKCNEARRTATIRAVIRRAHRMEKVKMSTATAPTPVVKIQPPSKPAPARPAPTPVPTPAQSVPGPVQTLAEMLAQAIRDSSPGKGHKTTTAQSIARAKDVADLVAEIGTVRKAAALIGMCPTGVSRMSLVGQWAKDGGRPHFPNSSMADLIQQAEDWQAKKSTHQSQVVEHAKPTIMDDPKYQAELQQAVDSCRASMPPKPSKPETAFILVLKEERKELAEQIEAEKNSLARMQVRLAAVESAIEALHNLTKV